MCHDMVTRGFLETAAEDMQAPVGLCGLSCSSCMICAVKGSSMLLELTRRFVSSCPTCAAATTSVIPCPQITSTTTLFIQARYQSSPTVLCLCTPQSWPEVQPRPRRDPLNNKDKAFPPQVSLMQKAAKDALCYTVDPARKMVD